MPNMYFWIWMVSLYVLVKLGTIWGGGEREREIWYYVCYYGRGYIMIWYGVRMLRCGDEMMEKYTLENGEYRLMEILNGIIWEK